MQASAEIEQYFVRIQEEVDRCYQTAGSARSCGHDPEAHVDVRLAKNMAERVEGLMVNVAPKLAGTGFTQRIMELESQYGRLDWRVALKVAEEVARQKFCRFSDEREAMEVGIRAGFTYHTGGIVSAPLEGFVGLRIKKNRKGESYLAPVYAGPIRGAGGTAAAFSLIITDYVRSIMGYGRYDADEREVSRFVREIEDYHDRATNLQYKPSQEEIEFLAKNLPIEIDGEPTEKFEVSNFKDLERVETNRIRGGMCLVFAEGLSQKAAKIWKRLSVWGDEFGLGWGFLREFLEIQKFKKAKDATGAQGEGISPNYTYISDLVAGRPVLTYPMAAGGFRLRYGRTRISGFSAAAISPATMVMLNKFIATGTQLKLERPGKAASITPCESVEGPTVRLRDKSVVQAGTAAQARRLLEQTEKILFLGDLLVSYGDFSENGHVLVPPGYCEEWWAAQAGAAGIVSAFGQKAEAWLRREACPTAKEAIQVSEKLGVPLHPRYLCYWKLIGPHELGELVAWFSRGETAENKYILPHAPQKEYLDMVGFVHKVVGNEYVVIEGEMAEIAKAIAMGRVDTEKTTLENLKDIFGFPIADKCGTFIGARMGRPEKAKMRKLAGQPQVLFPVGDEGGRLRSFQSALEKGRVTADFPVYRCPECRRETIYSVCENCRKPTDRLYFCTRCGLLETPCSHDCKRHRREEIDISHYFSSALKITGEKVYPDLIKGVRGTMNRDHVPEHLVKGILRAKHDIFVNKDGTVRFDMSELPITHFCPREIMTPVPRLIELGYTKDIDGRELKADDQIVEIMPQDLILPAGEALDEQSDKVLLRVAGFTDELLQKLYRQKPYYNAKKREDLVGHLVIGLAPHISAGTVGRIIGFSETQGMFAHPLFHAAMRRDCDGDEACVILLMDGLLNFSRQYLPDSRGAKTMDAPLVLTSRLNPAEVDDQAHGLDIAREYPLELYAAAMEMKYPWDVKVRQIKDALGTEKQYEGMGYTHPVRSINSGVNCSAYKALPSMQEKLMGQMELAEKIRAVDEANVAQLVIEKHLLRDTKGNLRKFSTQQFRCVSCNEKYRRPPLAGKCRCSGRLIFTVSHGSVIKYLEPTLSLAKKYNVPPYLRQTLELLQLRIDGVFGREREKQEGLGKWFG